MDQYLESSTYIDWKQPLVAAKAVRLARECADDEAIAKRCFEFVRDSIKHSWDHRLGPVTCKASEVLHHATGFCYAKSHLLAALLRANGIPSGICYQRLTVDHQGPPYCLHALNAVYLERYGWYRMDARGNNADVLAEFVPPAERLAFSIDHAGEKDLPEIWPEPLVPVITALTRNTTIEQVYCNLPDIEII